jgi:hypothetical protein
MVLNFCALVIGFSGFGTGLAGNAPDIDRLAHKVFCALPHLRGIRSPLNYGCVDNGNVRANAIAFPE